MPVDRKKWGFALQAFALAVLLLTATTASAQGQGNYSGHCRKLTRQIDRYEGQIDMARSRGNDVWEASTQAHVDRLRTRRSKLCPEYDQWVVAAAARRSAAEMAALMKLAAQAALTYFTGGAF